MQGVTRSSLDVGAGYAGHPGGGGGPCFGPLDHCCAAKAWLFAPDAGDAPLTYVGKGRGSYEPMLEYRYVGVGGGSFQRAGAGHPPGGWQPKPYGACVLSAALLVGALAGLAYVSKVIYEEGILPVGPGGDDALSKGLARGDAAHEFDVQGICEPGAGGEHRSADLDRWCCKHHRRRCPTSGSSPDNDCGRSGQGCVLQVPAAAAAPEATDTTTGSAAGAAITTTVLYDCQAPSYEVESGWTDDQRAWCCFHTGQGCVAAEVLTSTSVPLLTSALATAPTYTALQVPATTLPMAGVPAVPSSGSVALPGSCGEPCVYDGVSRTCEAQVQFAADHSFSDKPDACAVAHDAVRRACPNCVGCTSLYSTLCTKQEPATAPSSSTTVTPTAGEVPRTLPPDAASVRATTSSMTSTRTTTSLVPATIPTTQAPTTTSLLYDSLFCFSLIVPWTREPELLRMQLRRETSIFACDGFAAYSNPVQVLGRIKTKLLNTNLRSVMGTVHINNIHFRTAFNTPIFKKLWNQVIIDGQFKRHDWTAKVDPDAVFLPERLRDIVRGRDHDGARTGSGMFLNNCKLGLHGPLEVVSRRALRTYAAGHRRCKAPPQEDVYLQRCLLALGVTQLNQFDLLGDKLCYRGGWHQSPDWHECTGGTTAFHPFKSPRAYERCLFNATHHGKWR